MTEKRLFMGVLVMVVTKPGIQENHIESYVGWVAGRDEARGKWVEHALAKFPDGRLDSCHIHDITDVARNPE